VQSQLYLDLNWAAYSVQKRTARVSRRPELVVAEDSSESSEEEGRHKK
jgi:hypothetical protein